MTEATTEAKIDQAEADAFGERMMGVVNDAFLALMVSIGHRVGLYDTMVSLPPSTSMQIADAAGLNERYVREWLGAMVTGGVVDYDAPIGAYVLPAERAASLTRAAGPCNLASLMQFTALLGQVETKIVDCFRNGGGVPYSEYPEFHGLMRELSGATFDATLIAVTLPLVEGLPAQLEAGVGETLVLGLFTSHGDGFLGEVETDEGAVRICLGHDTDRMARAAADVGDFDSRFELLR